MTKTIIINSISKSKLKSERIRDKLTNNFRNNIYPNVKQYYIHCTARGIKGYIYAMRICKLNTAMLEYLIFDKYDNTFKWLNDNGYCKFSEKEEI